MKNTTTLIGAALLSFTAAAYSATTVTVVNFQFPANSANGVTLVDNVGTPLNNVAFDVGVITGALTDAASVIANFTSLGSGNTGSQIHFSTTADGSPSPQDDSSVFVVFGNGVSFAASTDFIVFEGNGNWGVEDAVLGGSSSVQLQASTLVYGHELTSNNTGVTGPFTAFTEGVSFGNIPEPSSSMLLGFAGLALVIRRKR